MNTVKASRITVLGVLCVLAPIHATLQAQTAPAPHPSLSNPKKAKAAQSKTPAKLEQASQEDLAEAVLGDSLEGIFERVDEHFHHGEYNHCINLNRIIVQGDPKNLDSYSNGAYLLWSSERNEEAISFLKQGAEANPDSYFMHDELGRHLLTQSKRPKEALPYLLKATKFECPFYTWNSLANCYEKLGQWDKAVETWTIASKYLKNEAAKHRLEAAKKHLAGTK